MYTSTPDPSMPNELMTNGYLNDVLKLIDELKSHKPKKSQLQYELAVSYEEGLNELSDRPNLAIKWYEKAAKNGHAEAQYKLAIAYADGTHGLTKRPDLAVDWCEKAVKKGHAEAYLKLPELHFELAKMFHQDGVSIKKNIVKAIYYYKLSSTRGLASASYHLGCIYKDRENLPVEEQDHAIQKAIDYFRLASSQGDEDALAKIEHIYEEGLVSRPEAPKPKLIAPAAPEGFNRDRRRKVQSIIPTKDGTLQIIGDKPTTLTLDFNRQPLAPLSDASINNPEAIMPIQDTSYPSKAHPLLQEALLKENKRENSSVARKPVPRF